MGNLEKELSKAVQHFWHTRLSQQERQGTKTGIKDAGNRSAVTGGKHADGFVSLIGSILAAGGVNHACLFSKEKKALPCYFRPAKEWDLIAKVGENLLAVVEVKSHVGSFGNNFNNRVEEAIGSATDFWTAYRESSFVPSARPWLGYLMMLEDAPGSTEPLRPVSLPHYPMRSEFVGATYARRYEIFCQRLVRERLYDAACFLMSSKEEGIKGRYFEPNRELSFRNFAMSLSARAAAVAALGT